MNYFRLQETVLSLVDRQADSELQSLMVTFTTLAEAKLNRLLRVGLMTTRSVTVTFDQDYYALPLDMLAIRDIELVNGDTRTTLQYVNPEQANNASNTVGQDTCFYTIMANQFQLVGTTPIGQQIEIVYYQTLRPIYEGNDDNWLSWRYPDAYIQAMMVEVQAYVKDQEAMSLWNGRLTTTIQEINDADQSDRWSGTPLQVRTG